jgi:hypothetical protein
MAREALDILATDPDGFVLMVEGGQIDTAAHANNYARMTGEVLALDDAVATALAFADTHPGTLVIVTADHETGGLTSTRNADGSLSFAFTTTGHTATTVPVRSIGPGADGFGTATVPNTRVFEVVRGALGLGATAPTPTPTPATSTQSASIRFTSVPAGGSIYLDGTYRGTTPATLSGVALGSHAVEIRMPGYQTWTKSIQVTADFLAATYSYNPALVATATTPTPTSTAAPSKTASIKFTSVPAGGKIYLDGAYRGITPATIPGIDLGTHRAEIRYSGYQSWVKSITVTQDFLSRVCSYNPTLIAA